MQEVFTSSDLVKCWTWRGPACHVESGCMWDVETRRMWDIETRCMKYVKELCMRRAGVGRLFLDDPEGDFHEPSQVEFQHLLVAAPFGRASAVLRGAIWFGFPQFETTGFTPKQFREKCIPIARNLCTHE